MSSVVIILGCIATFTVPDLFWKMIAIGFAAGAEGAFSALFSILINEATSKIFVFGYKLTKKASATKIRSTLISGSFVAYGFGCIAINIITFYILNVEYLVLLACGMVVVTVYPSFISYFESPMWLAGKG